MQNSTLIQSSVKSSPVQNQSFANQLLPKSALEKITLHAAKLSDQELYKKCQLYGGEARKWSRRFATLLPEVARRELYKKYGFYSIFEFAAKLAGIKHETVVDILRVTQKLEDKPLLRVQMEKYGWGKLKVVTTIATKENEKMLAEKVATMSKSTLETFVREIRKQNDEKNIPQHSGENVQSRTGSAENEILGTIQSEQSNLLETKQGVNSSTKLQQQAQEVQNLPPSVPPAQNRIFVRLFLAPKNELKLKELQKKLSREQKAPVDLNEVVGILLDAYEKREDKVDEPAPAAKNSKSAKSVKTSVKIAESKTTEPAIKPKQNAVLPKPTPSQSQSAEKSAEPSRHIPTKIKKILYQKFAGRCAWPECIKLPKIFHHTLRFSLNPSHDSDNIVPLCKNHEQLAHHGLIENEEKSPENWRLKTETDRSAQKYQIDQKVIFHYAPQ